MVVDTKYTSRNAMLRDFKYLTDNIDIAIEIGVFRGEFSFEMINALQPKNFYGVDPFELYEGCVTKPGPEFENQEKLDQLANRVRSELLSRDAQLIRKQSKEASLDFEDNSVDVVYIDGDHTYEGVKLDIEVWWPKVKPGGFLCGHDYCKGTTGFGYPYGVIEAVQERFTNEEVIVTHDSPPSWCVRK